MFSFGENWASFSQGLTEAHIQEAMQSIVNLLGKNTLEENSFLDIGCGSGLFSIAAVRLGARNVLGVDIDPLSIETSQRNARRWLSETDLNKLSFRQGLLPSGDGSSAFIIVWESEGASHDLVFFPTDCCGQVAGYLSQSLQNATRYGLLAQRD